MAIHSSILAWENPMDQKPGRLPSVGWQIVGETMEIVRDFIFLGSEITEMVTETLKLKDTYSLEGKL